MPADALISHPRIVDKYSPEEGLRRIWREIANGIRPHVSSDAFQRWFASIELVEASETALSFQVPNTIYQLWIESNYLNLVQSAALAVLGGPREVRFIVRGDGEGAINGENNGAELLAEAPPPSKPLEREAESGAMHGMNPRNSFETFVVGSNNQFAHAAALAVAQAPAKTYNPLFIYGGVGLGKTHLMHAVGQHVLERKKSFKVMYLSSERFTNEFIDA